MTEPSPPAGTTALAGGQTLRLPGSSRNVSLHEQLYRYADDLHEAVVRNELLTANNVSLRASAANLKEACEELEAIIRNSFDIHLVTSGSGLLLQWNPASALLGSPAELRELVLGDLVVESDRSAYQSLVASALDGAGSPPRGIELRLHRANRQGPPLIVSTSVMRVRRGAEGASLHWVLRDLTRLRETEFETQVANVVFNNSDQGVLVTDVEGGILAVNTAFTEITGYTREEVLGHAPSFLNSGHQTPEFYTEFWRSLSTTGSWQGHLFNRRKNGETYPEKLTVNAVRDANGQILSYIGLFTDLSRADDESFADSGAAGALDLLTRLPSRDLFEDRLQRLVLLSRRNPFDFTLLRINLYGFSRINAEHGHQVGDLTLREVAWRLTTAMRESDTVARIEADDFVVLAPCLGADSDRRNFIDKLVSVIAAPMEIAGRTLQIAASTGSATYPGDAEDAPGLMAAAERALTEARAARQA